MLKHYIGLFNPANGELELVEAKKLVVRGAVRTQQAADEDMRAQEPAAPQVRCPRLFRRLDSLTDTIQSMYDLKTELGQAFGTKKAKKALAAVTENAISPRNPRGDGPEQLDASEKALMASIKDVTMSIPSREDLQNAIDASKPIPNGHYDAEEVQDVYKPEELIGKDILELIQVKDWQQSVKKNEDIKLRTRFVAHRVSRIGSGENAVYRLRLLRYTYLLQLFLMTAKKGKERGTLEILKRDKLQEELAPAPPPVIESIRRKFSDQGIIRKQHMDLLRTYLCVLACILDNFETDNWDLKEDLKMEQRQMNQYFYEIGARVNKKKVEDGRTASVAVLKLPLVFPKVGRGRR